MDAVIDLDSLHKALKEEVPALQEVPDNRLRGILNILQDFQNWEQIRNLEDPEGQKYLEGRLFGLFQKLEASLSVYPSSISALVEHFLGELKRIYLTFLLRGLIPEEKAVELGVRFEELAQAEYLIQKKYVRRWRIIMVERLSKC